MARKEKEAKKDYKAAVGVLRGKIDNALKGENVGEGIKQAVWDMLQSLEIAAPKAER